MRDDKVLRLKVRARNNRLYKLIINDGWLWRGKTANVAAFSRFLELGSSEVGDLLNLTRSPVYEKGKGRKIKGDYSDLCKKIAIYFEVEVEWLFPLDLYQSIVNPKLSKDISLENLPEIFIEGTISETKAMECGVDKLLEQFSR